mgnify:CR=1 FL=1
MSKIGDLIQRLRIKKGLTQAQLAEEFGITDKAVGKWEQGQGDPDLSLIIPISKFFGITTDELLNGLLDEFTNDVNKSIFEKIVLSGLDKLPKFIDQGINLFGTDEYNKTLIDYVYEHRSAEFLKYAVQNNWFEKIEIQFTVLTKRNSYYGNMYENKNIVFYFQKHFTDKVKRIFTGIIKNQDKWTYRIQNPVERYYTINSSAFDVFEYDTINILAIMIENENKEMLASFANYSYFKKPSIETKVLEAYSNRSTFDEGFLIDVLKLFSFGELLHLAIQSNNKVLMDLLAKIYDSSVHGLSKEYIGELIKLNHLEINKKILVNYNFEYKEDFALIYQYNKFVYDRLPNEIKQRNAHYLAALVTDKSENDILLHLNLKELISSENVKPIAKHLELVDHAVAEVDKFLDEIVQLKNNDSEIVFDKLVIKKFNDLFGNYFIYQPFNSNIYFDNDGILKPAQQEEFDKISEQRKSHEWLQVKLLSSTTNVKKLLYGFIKYTFDNSFEYELSKMPDEILMILVPYLNEYSINQILNNYNKDNQAIIKLLLENGGKFYKDYQSNPNNTIAFNYSVVDFRTAREVEYDNSRNANKYDMMKTMQFKLLLGIK